MANPIAGKNASGAFLSTDAQALLLIPTETALLLAGAKGPPRFRYRLYRSDISGARLEEIIGVVEDATITLSNFRDHTWELSVRLRESDALDVFTDWVKAEVHLGDDDAPDGWQRFPMGHYRFTSPRGTRTRAPNSDTLELVGRSGEGMLLEDAAYLGYLVPSESGVLATVRQILIDRGIPPERIFFPTDEVVLPAPVYFDAAQNATAVRWLRIANTLLASGGYVALYTDAEGNFLTQKIEAGEDSSAEVRYGSEQIYERHIIEDVSYEYDDERFANRIVVRSEDVNQIPPIVGVAENHNPSSRGSIENYGVRQGEPFLFKTIASQEAADLIASQLLVSATGFNLKVSLSTMQDPRRGPKETYELALYRDDGTLAFDGKWSVTGWSLPLNLGAMTHEISAFVPI